MGTHTLSGYRLQPYSQCFFSGEAEVIYKAPEVGLFETYM